MLRKYVQNTYRLVAAGDLGVDIMPESLFQQGRHCCSYLRLEGIKSVLKVIRRLIGLVATGIVKNRTPQHFLAHVSKRMLTNSSVTAAAGSCSASRRFILLKTVHSIPISKTKWVRTHMKRNWYQTEIDTMKYAPTYSCVASSLRWRTSSLSPT